MRKLTAVLLGVLSLCLSAWPVSAQTGFDLELFANQAYSTLAVAVDDDDTTITVASGDGAKFPSPTGGQYFRILLIEGTTWEGLTCTARSTDDLTCERGTEGSASSFTTAARVVHGPTAAMLAAIRDRIATTADVTHKSLTAAQALGADLGTNTGFTGNATNWTLDTFSYSSNTVVHTGGSPGSITQTTYDYQEGVIYRVAVDVSALSVAGEVEVCVDGACVSSDVDTADVWTFFVRAGEDDSAGLIISVDDVFDGTFDSVAAYIEPAAITINEVNGAGGAKVYASGDLEARWIWADGLSLDAISAESVLLTGDTTGQIDHPTDDSLLLTTRTDEPSGLSLQTDTNPYGREFVAEHRAQVDATSTPTGYFFTGDRWTARGADGTIVPVAQLGCEGYADPADGTISSWGCSLLMMSSVGGLTAPGDAIAIYSAAPDNLNINRNVIIGSGFSGTPAQLRMLEASGNGTNTVSITAPASVGSDVVLTLPVATDTLTGKATTDTLTNKTLDAEGTGNVLTFPFFVNYSQVAVCQNTTALSAVSMAATAPTPTCVTGSNNNYGVLQYPDSNGSYDIFGHFPLPSDWTGNIDFSGKYRASATSGDVAFQLSTACVADAETGDPSYNTAQVIADTVKGTTLQWNDFAQTSVTTTGCAAGEEFNWRLRRDRTHASDTTTGTIDLISLSFKIRRAM